MRGNHSGLAMLGLTDRGDDYGSAKTVRWPDEAMKSPVQWSFPLWDRLVGDEVRAFGCCSLNKSTRLEILRVFIISFVVPTQHSKWVYGW